MKNKILFQKLDLKHNMHRIYRVYRIFLLLSKAHVTDFLKDSNT